MQSAPREAPPNKSVKLAWGPAGEWHEVGRWGFQSGLVLFLFDRWGDPQTSKVLTFLRILGHQKDRSTYLVFTRFQK